MMRRICKRIAASAAAISMLLILGIGSARADVDTLLFLLPDTANLTDPKITVWLDAAAEEGLHVLPMSDSQFIQLGASSSQYVGVVLPDQVHTTASSALVGAVQGYVSRGGKLMLVYDAGVLLPDGTYPVTGPSRFSSLAGTTYADYGACYPNCDTRFVALVRATAPQSTMRTLGVAPGKSWTLASSSGADPMQGITSYVYGFLNYPSYVTGTSYTGTYLLSASNTTMPLAGINNYGNGRVLFVNTPLGYLKGYGTDGLLLHNFLHYFAVNLLRLPYLAALPNGTPGMVLNVHVDDGSAINDIATLAQRGVWDHHPFSIHFTAGPDVDTFGDGSGMNLPANTVAQNWVRTLRTKGHAIGSHGGWIHNYFGQNVSETNQANFQQYLDLNKQAIDAVLRRPVVEYSAPLGNTPNWSVDWMEQKGFLAYYFVGNTGTAPTRAYRDGVLRNKKIWSFGVTTYFDLAAFEEFDDKNIPAADITNWLLSLVDFDVQHRTVREFYFHPPGALLYPASLDALLKRGEQYVLSNQFRWYAMTDLATFLSRRELVSWRVSRLSTGALQFDVSHPSDLNGLAWVLPKSAYSQPVAVSGVSVTNDTAAAEWVVIGNAGAKSAQFRATRLTPF